MKVLLINGSPRAEGCTYTALKEVEKELNANGIDTEIIHVGKEVISGCRACAACRKIGKCAIDDCVNVYGPRLAEFDGFIIGSPVYYSGPSGQICAFMDRLCYSHGKYLAGKPGACVVSCRRGGASAAFDRLNKYFSILNMPIVTSQYWNQVHGNTPDEVKQDLEGLQTMRTLAKNMAWLLKCIEAGDANGVSRPQYEQKIVTSFIRPE